MPNKENAKKAVLKSQLLQKRNRLVNAELKSLRVRFRKLLDEKNGKEASVVLQSITKGLDRAHGKGILKKNTVARSKSRLTKRLNALTAV